MGIIASFINIIKNVIECDIKAVPFPGCLAYKMQKKETKKTRPVE
jgi:hypothetical protein